MVRKQLYLAERQEKDLKRRARALGVSEAELVRRALDALFRGEPVARPLPGRTNALRDLLDGADAVAARGHRLPRRYRFRREDQYEQREDALVGR